MEERVVPKPLEFMKEKKLKIGVVVVFALSFLAHPLLKELFFQYSLEVMASLKSSAIFEGFINLFGFLGNTPTGQVLSILLLAFGFPKESAFVLLALQSSELLNRYLKPLFGVFRPWYYNPEVTNCKAGFADPSGHAMASTALFVSCWLLFHRKLSGRFGRSASLIVAFVFAFLEGCVFFHRIQN